MLECIKLVPKQSASSKVIMEKLTKQSNGDYLFFGQKVPPLSLSSQRQRYPWSFKIKNNQRFRNKQADFLLWSQRKIFKMEMGVTEVSICPAYQLVKLLREEDQILINNSGYLRAISGAHVDFLHRKPPTTPHLTQMFPIHYLVLQISQCSRQSFLWNVSKKG